MSSETLYTASALFEQIHTTFSLGLNQRGLYGNIGDARCGITLTSITPHSRLNLEEGGTPVE